MKRLLGVFLLPLDEIIIHRSATPSKFAGIPSYTWVESGRVRVKCLGLEPGPFDLGTGALTMRPLGLTIRWTGVKKNSQFQRFQTRVYPNWDLFTRQSLLWISSVCEQLSVLQPQWKLNYLEQLRIHYSDENKEVFEGCICSAFYKPRR